MVAVIPKCHSNGCCHSKWLLSFQNVKVFKLIIKTYVTYFHRNIKTQGIATAEILSVMVSIDFVNRLKPRRVAFFKCIFKNSLVR